MTLAVLAMRDNASPQAASKAVSPSVIHPEINGVQEWNSPGKISEEILNEERMI
ncbi:hypothetical protein [Leisingera sp. F5]|uniref:hypothetical protein n=1 Tax=Leisingera sp. F5 TaxID=1813816 RepID=UPI000A507011|nr:hypothetical protein [Leisingera sp. F5]